MDSQAKTKATREFASAFADSLAASIALAIGAPWPLEVPQYPDTAADNGVPMHFRLKLDGALSGECYVEFYEPQIALLISKMQPEAPETTSPEMTSEERGDAFAKVISGAVPLLSETLSASYGAVTVKVDRVSGLAFGGMFVVPISATADPSGAPVMLYFDAHLLDALTKLTRSKKLGDSSERQVNPYNLKLVMDVELNVSLLFGRRQLPLRDVLDLASGSVIELDRMVDEPVELLLDGKVIARGEAVIVDGNYGLRVTEIPQPVANHFLN